MQTNMTSRHSGGGRVNNVNLRKLRNDTGLTQTELAKLAGITQGHLWRLEAGKRDCTADTLRQIANVIADTLDSDVGSVLKELTDP